MATVNIKKQDGSYEKVADTLGVLVPQGCRYSKGQLIRKSGSIAAATQTYLTFSSPEGEEWFRDGKLVIPEEGVYSMHIVFTTNDSTGKAVDIYPVEAFSPGNSTGTWSVSNVGIKYLTKGTYENYAVCYLDAEKQYSDGNVGAFLTVVQHQVAVPFLVANRGALVSFILRRCRACRLSRRWWRCLFVRLRFARSGRRRT